MRQCERVIYLRVLRHGVVGAEAIGECPIKVKADLIDVGFPKRQSYTMMHEGKTCCKVIVSQLGGAFQITGSLKGSSEAKLIPLVRKDSDPVEYSFIPL